MYVGISSDYDVNFMPVCDDSKLGLIQMGRGLIKQHSVSTNYRSSRNKCVLLRLGDSIRCAIYK